MDIKELEKKYSLEEIKQNKENLERQLTEASLSRNKDIGSLSTELYYVTDLYSLVSNLFKAISDYKEAKSLLDDGSDKDMTEMAREEISRLEEEIPQLDHAIVMHQVSYKLSDPDDQKSVMIEIRAGAGGEEAALFAADLFKMYSQYATNQGWNVQIIFSSVSDNGGYKEVTAQITGKNAYKMLKYESGVHRVQRIPVTESAGRIHTSTASVAILPEAKDIDIEINPSEIRIDVMRASGAGGQCVNRTDSAVRITHFATGIVVSCQETKHQSQNKEKAMMMLRTRLYEKKKREEEAKRADMRSSQIGNAMRAEKIRTYNYPQNRITDHRIKKSWFNIEEVMRGEIQEILDDVNDAFLQMQLEDMNQAESVKAAV